MNVSVAKEQIEEASQDALLGNEFIEDSGDCLRHHHGDYLPINP
jgi:hypothetical protein